MRELCYWKVFVIVGVILFLPSTHSFFSSGTDELPHSIDIAANEQDITIYGIDSNDLLGKTGSVAIGDFNGDGNQDILLGAPLGDGPGNSRIDAGEAYVIFGSAALPPSIDLADFPGPSVTIYGINPGDNTGFAVAAGDVNGDDIDDILISAPGGDGPNNDRDGLGEVYLIFGRPTLSATTIIDLSSPQSFDTIIYGTTYRGKFGAALTTGDVNGDGVEDIIIGSPEADGPAGSRPDGGNLYLVWGSHALSPFIDLRSSQVAHTVIFGADRGDLLGSSVATTDANGDGISDILIGAPGADGAGNALPDSGDAYLIYGKETFPREIDLGAAAADVAIFGRDPGDKLGTSVLISDVDGDGVEDLILGAPGARGPDNLRGGAGEVYVIYGREGFPPTLDLANTPADAVTFGRAPLDGLGSSLVSGDVNKDGVKDLIIGAPGGDGPEGQRSDAGEAYLIYGGSLPTQLDLAEENPDVIIYGADPLDNLGSALASGDIDGDDTDDLLLGAIGADGPKDRIPDAGEAYLIYRIPKPQHPPVADAGPDQTVLKGEVVQLDGSGSYDPDDDPLTYIWSFVVKPEGSAAVLSDPNAVRPTFIADAVGRYVLELKVDDGRGGIDTDEVEIIVLLGMKGDVDLDGDVDIVDAQWAAEYIVGLRELSGVQKYNADVRSPCRPPDTNIDVTDVRWIAEYAIGIVTEMDCYESSSSSSPSGVAVGATTMVNARLRLESKAIIPGEIANVRLFLHLQQPDKGRVDLQVGPEGALTFDPRVIQVQSIRGLGPYRVLASKIDNVAGLVRFVLTSVPVAALGLGEAHPEAEPAEAVAELLVKAIGAEGTGSLIKLSKVDVLRGMAGQDLATEVTEGRITIGSLRVGDVMAFPNPVRSSASVTFRVEGSGIAEIRVEIYDLSGRIVFNSGWVSNGFEWHLMDRQGRVVANGIYLYTVTVRGLDGTALHSKVRKLVILR